ncbi:MAG TPA: PVC-type heme-binding CxxCH protein, partial [Planctomycetaceae bacterium]|nr:PVC-type heme-binding CxxCH protein [Planctomycetaceae bacterium]
GSFPPDYTSGLAEPRRYAVPGEHVLPGKDNVIAIRVFDHDGRGGFKGTAPMLVNGSQAIAMNGRWEFRTGDDLKWAKGPIALTTTGIYWRVQDLADVQQRFAAQNGGALPPDEAATTFTVPDGLELVQVLAEPHVRQPLFFEFDERGRLWVMNYLQYPYPEGLKMVSKDEFWRAVYDRIPDPPPQGARGADRITIHEDTDGDGAYDKHTTFLEGLNISTSFARGRGGVWVLNPPYLLFYPDRDNDDVPDGDPEVHLAGFGMEDTHSVVNSLRWGPDGWLYACQGSTVSGNVRVVGRSSTPSGDGATGADGVELRPTSEGGLESRPTYSMGQLIWRYHPETRRYEIFAEGGGNAFGLEIDAKGRIYSGHNGGDTRGFHYVQGAYYRKGFTKHGPLSNPYSFGFFEHMQHHAVPRFTHNFLIYEGGALPGEYRGRLFGVEPLQGKVVMSEFEPDRSSFKTRDLDRVIQSTDPQFRPVEIKTGPDGAMYVADFYEPQISHREHFSGQIDKSNGRVYRLQAKGAKPGPAFDLGRTPSRKLVDVLRHENKWFRQTAQRLLADRKDRGIVPLLRENIRTSGGQFALECLWALSVSGGLDDEAALETLAHEDADVRLWTVRLVCDDHHVSPTLSSRLAELAARETYVHVRSQLASSAKRLPAADGLPIVRRLLAHDEDAADIHLPLLLWWAIEARAGSDAEAVLALFAEPAVWKLPLVEEHILTRLMQRYATSGTRQDLLACAKLFELAPGKKHSDLLMSGFEQAFKGRSLATLPAELVAALAEAGGGSLILGVRQGKAEAVEQALAAIGNDQTDAARRLEYVQLFGEVDQPQCVPVLLKLLHATSEGELRKAALTSLGRYAEPRIGTEVVGLYAALPAEVQDVARTLLVSRRPWTLAFLQAVDAGRIEAAALPLDDVRKMTVHDDEEIAGLIRRHWRDIQGASTAEMQQEIQRLTSVLAAGSGNPYEGKKLYTQSCGKCHLLFAEGGRIGPDLTTYQRKDQLALLI